MFRGLTDCIDFVGHLLVHLNERFSQDIGTFESNRLPRHE